VKIVKLAAVLLALAALAAPAALAATPRTITVNGSGTVSTTPNEADFTFGVSATAGTATAALHANAREMTKVIAALRAQGVAAADIQTAQISLTPNRNQTGDKILNYTATNQVTARVRSIAKAGPVIDAAVNAGANEVDGPTLTSADARVLSQAALKAAVADARQRAQAIASAAGVKLGAVQTVSEQTSSTPIPFSAAKAAASPTPVEAGTVQIEADVTATFAIK
jgi:uncharacterized protein YggE